MNVKPEFSKEIANRVIGSLRKGTPPEEGISLFSVGREDLLQYFDNKLSEISEFGLSDIKFVSADWGHGKSHFLDLLKELALNKKFVVSKVELHSKEVPFDQLQLVIQRIMANIEVPGEEDQGVEALLNTWCEKHDGYTEKDLFESLKRAKVYPELRLKLVDYYKHYFADEGREYGQCLQALKWFEGRETKAKTFPNVKEYLHNVVNLINSMDYNGFIVMLDEAEAITSLSRIGRRDLANENIRQIIDNDQDTRRFYLVFASTPTFLSGEDEKGAQSYPALWRRISDPLREVHQDSLNKVIVELPELTEDEFLRLASNIKKCYENAEGREISKISEEDMKLLVDYIRTRTDQKVGTMVRASVAILDEAQSETFDFSQKFEIIVEKTIEQENIARAR